MIFAIKEMPSKTHISNSPKTIDEERSARGGATSCKIIAKTRFWFALQSKEK